MEGCTYFSELAEGPGQCPRSHAGKESKVGLGSWGGGQAVAAPAHRGEQGTMWVTGQMCLLREVRMWWGAPRKSCEILGRETSPH